MSVSGGERRAVLEPLQSDTSYKVTVTPVYSDGQDGLGASAMGSTCKANKHTKCKAHTHTHTSLAYCIDHNAAFLPFHNTKMQLLV